MKKNMIQTVLVLFLCAISSSIKAYNWHLLNKTNKTLIIQVELLHSKNPYFVVAGPNESANFDWPAGNAMAGFCLGAIKYVVADDALLSETSIVKGKKTVADNAKMLQWLDQHKDKYPRITANVELTDPKSFIKTGSILKYPCASREDIVIMQEGNNLIFKGLYSKAELDLSMFVDPRGGVVKNGKKPKWHLLY